MADFSVLHYGKKFVHILLLHVFSLVVLKITVDVWK